MMEMWRSANHSWNHWVLMTTCWLRNWSMKNTSLASSQDQMELQRELLLRCSWWKTSIKNWGKTTIGLRGQTLVWSLRKSALIWLLKFVSFSIVIGALKNKFLIFISFHRGLIIHWQNCSNANFLNGSSWWCFIS